MAIVGVILINGVFSFWQEYRAERALAALEKLLPHRVKVVRDGQVELRAANELVPGDVIALEADSRAGRLPRGRTARPSRAATRCAGFELGSGMAINTVLPEDAVAFLTEVAVVENGKNKLAAA